jgi:tetratricopeptide (TPR) repeat protein
MAESTQNPAGALASSDLSTLRARSVELYGRRRLAEAEQACARILTLEPMDFDALLMLGALATETGRLSSAVDYFARAVRANDSVPHAHNNLGVVLAGLRRVPEALASFERAIALSPRFAEAHCNRGAALEQLGRPGEALESYGLAIALEPRCARAHRNRGSALQLSGRLTEALECYEKAIALEPGFAAAHSRRAAILLELGRPREALASCDRAIELTPGLADAHLARAATLRQCSRPAEALASCDRAIALGAGSAEAYASRGAILHELGRHEEALVECRKALRMDPNYAHAHWYAALALRRTGRAHEALAAWDRTIGLQPNSVAAKVNRGLVLYELGRYDEALRDYREAMTLSPQDVDSHWNASWCLLKTGRLEEGWQLLEWRHKLACRSVVRAATRPRWTGLEPLSGRTLLIHCEQGIGDIIQFCRYVELTRPLGARVILEVPESLGGLMATLAGVTQRITLGEPWPEHDYQCPIMSLPLAFRTLASSIPAHVPYLHADPAKALDWKVRLGPRRKPRVGLVWSAGVRDDQPELWTFERRNILLRELAPLRRAEVEFHSLQKGEAAERQLAEAINGAWGGPGIVTHSDQLRDFADTAALIENLDLVISVDTAVAHLAGALGKPVWILLGFAACWRWFLERSDSPWYPTATLYRQESAGDWTGVIRRVCVDLARLGAPESMPS